MCAARVGNDLFPYGSTNRMCAPRTPGILPTHGAPTMCGSRHDWSVAEIPIPRTRGATDPVPLGELNADLRGFPPDHPAPADRRRIKPKFKCVRDADRAEHFKARTTFGK